MHRNALQLMLTTHANSIEHTLEEMTLALGLAARSATDLVVRALVRAAPWASAPAGPPQAAVAQQRASCLTAAPRPDMSWAIVQPLANLCAVLFPVNYSRHLTYINLSSHGIAWSTVQAPGPSPGPDANACVYMYAVVQHGARTMDYGRIRV